MKKSSKEKAAGKKGAKIGLIIAAVTIAFVGTFSVCVALNIGGLGVKTNNYLASLPVTRNFFKAVPPAMSPEEIEKERIKNEKRILEEERKKLEEFSSNLQAWELQLKAKESELNAKESEIKELEEKLEPRLHKIQDLAAYYEKMDSADAVQIINNMSDNELIIVILKNMRQQKSSEILSLMDPKKAARIMEIMSSQ